MAKNLLLIKGRVMSCKLEGIWPLYIYRYVVKTADTNKTNIHYLHCHSSLPILVDGTYVFECKGREIKAVKGASFA